MPGKNRVSLSDDRQLRQSTSPKSFPINGKTTSLVVSQQNTITASLLTADLDFYLKICDILHVPPAREHTEYREHQMKGQEKE